MTTTRHQAREAALQVLYFCHISGANPDEALPAFFEEHLPDADASLRAFASTLVHGAVGDAAALDALIQQHSQHWRLERLAIIDRLILRMGGWELQHEPDVAPAVIIDEAIELARTYSSEESVGFVNGVLDAMKKAVGHRP